MFYHDKYDYEKLTAIVKMTGESQRRRRRR
jgi:hypothetical protein